MLKIEIKGAIPRLAEYNFAEPPSWKITEGENWAVIGPNGAGKTLLTDILQGKIVLKEGEVSISSNDQRENYNLVKSMSFRDIYSITDSSNTYYQQRWNSTEVEESPRTRTLLRGYTDDKIAHYSQLFKIENLLEKPLITLSSGELRKFLITRTLMSEPRVLILDNPFIGLDSTSRNTLEEMLKQMNRLNELQTIFVLSDPNDIPQWVDKVLPILERRCLKIETRDTFLKNIELIDRMFGANNSAISILDITKEYNGNVVDMENVTIKYDNRTILNGVDWRVDSGEKWALLGENGSGKSTLLSIIYGDNPQSYANKVSLFGQMRGGGESIWDIKKRIGYLSSDMHTYFLQDIPCIEIVASGFFDSIGLYRKCTESQINTAMQWMRIFAAEHLANRSFLRISYGEQRLILIARAFVKEPELLILDEPMHGLDSGKKQRVKQIIDSVCSHEGKTLIYVTHCQDEMPDCVTKIKRLTKGY